MRCTLCNSSFRFSVWILQCGECKEQFCTKCMERKSGIHYCKKCLILITRPPDINELMKLKSKDLQEYLKRHNIPTFGIVEKRELVELLCNRSIPVKSTKTSTVFNKIFTNFETIFVNGENRQSPTTSPTSPTGGGGGGRVPPPRPPPPTSPPPSQQQSTTSGIQQPQQQRPPFPSSSSSTTHLNIDPGGCSYVGNETRTAHTLPKETRPTKPSAPPQQQQPLNQPTINQQSQPQQQSFEKPPSPEASPLPRRLPKLSDYQSAEDLTALSAKELKILLTLNRVDYKGCVEKSELLEKAEMLWLDNFKQKCEELPSNLEDLCKLCMDAPLDCVLLECGHIATCVDCGKKLAECPICRQYVSRVVRTFKA